MNAGGGGSAASGVSGGSIGGGSVPSPSPTSSLATSSNIPSPLQGILVSDISTLGLFMLVVLLVASQLICLLFISIFVPH